MPGISVSKICVPFGGGGINWSSYWATLISATVENAAPTHVVLTFPTPQTSLGATDITCTVNAVNRVVSSASWTGGVWTVVLASAVLYGDVVEVDFIPSGDTESVVNNVGEAETLALVARITTPPTAARKATIDKAVKALKAGGIWAKAKIIYFRAAKDVQAGLLNWVTDDFNASVVVGGGTVTFTEDIGITAWTTHVPYLDYDFNPSVDGVSQNNLGITVFLNTTSTPGNFWDIGTSVGGSTFGLACNYGGNIYGLMNEGTFNTTKAADTSAGFISLNRNSSSNVLFNINGTTSNVSSNSSGVANVAVKEQFLASGTTVIRNMPFVYIGEALTIAESNALRAAVIDYLEDLGWFAETYLYFGQSNCGGRDVPANATIEGYDSTITDGKIYNTTSKAFEDIVPGTNCETFPATNFGAECAFMRHLVSVKGIPQYLIKYGPGGASLLLDDAGGNFNIASTVAALYVDLKALINEAVLNARVNKKIVKITAIIRMQGEADADDEPSATAFEANLTALWADIITFCNGINAKSGYSNTIKCIECRISDSASLPHRSGVRAAQDACGKIVIDTDSYGKLGDDIHYSADGLINLGIAIGNELD